MQTGFRIQNPGACFTDIKQDTLTTVGQYFVTKHGNVSAAEAYVISFWPGSGLATTGITVNLQFKVNGNHGRGQRPEQNLHAL